MVNAFGQRLTLIAAASACMVMAVASLAQQPKLAVKPLWQVEFAASFHFDAAENDGVVSAIVDLDGPGSHALVALDKNGEERWRFSPPERKVLLGGMSADGSRLACVELPAERQVAPRWTVHLLDGATGRQVARMPFGEYYHPAPKLSADGSALLITDFGKEFLALYDGEGKQLWSAEDVKPELPVADLTFSRIMPDGSGAILGSRESFFHVSRTGERWYEITTGVFSDDLQPGITFSRSGDLLVVWGNKYDKWIGNPSPVAPGRAKYFPASRLYLQQSCVGVYGVTLPGWDFPSRRTLCAIGWLGRAEDAEVCWADAIREGDVLILAVVFRHRTVLYRVPLKERGVPTTSVELPGLEPGCSVSLAWSEHPRYLAALAPASSKKEGRETATLALYDTHGRKLWGTELAGGTGGHSDVWLSADAKRLYAAAGRALHAFSISE